MAAATSARTYTWPNEPRRVACLECNIIEFLFSAASTTESHLAGRQNGWIRWSRDRKASGFWRSLPILLTRLNRAIALSIQDAKVPNAPKVSQPETGPRDIIEILSSDEEDLPDEDDTFKAEIRRAIEASKAPSAVVKTEEPKNTVKTESGIPTTPLANITPVIQSTFPFDRAQLERDRLARLKRLRPDLAEAQSSSGTKNADSDNEDDRDHDSKRQRVSNSSSAIRRSDLSSSSRPAASSSTSQSPNTENIFWSGELRQTANKHVDKLKDTRPIFTLTDTLAPVSRCYILSKHISIDRYLAWRNIVRYSISLLYRLSVDIFFAQPSYSRNCSRTGSSGKGDIKRGPPQLDQDHTNVTRRSWLHAHEGTSKWMFASMSLICDLLP